MTTFPTDEDRRLRGDERAVLEAMLDLQRHEVAGLLAGVSEHEDRERRSPSLHATRGTATSSSSS